MAGFICSVRSRCDRARHSLAVGSGPGAAGAWFVPGFLYSQSASVPLPFLFLAGPSKFVVEPVEPAVVLVVFVAALVEAVAEPVVIVVDLHLPELNEQLAVLVEAVAEPVVIVVDLHLLELNEQPAVLVEQNEQLAAFVVVDLVVA